MFNRQTLIEMLTVQNNLNKAMGGNSWLQSDNSTRPYYRAAWVEGGEGVAHYGYKWWKQYDRSKNIGQVRLEVIDMLHFVLSDELRSVARNYVTASEGSVAPDDVVVELDSEGQFTDSTVNQLIEVTADRIISAGIIDIPDDIASVEETFILVSEQFVAQSILRRTSKIKFWGTLADALNLTIEEAGLWYLGKAALNFLRDANGQKQDTYVKVWWGVEDNVYLEKWLEAYRTGAVVLSGTVFEEITNYLEAQYSRLMNGESAIVLTP